MVVLLTFSNKNLLQNKAIVLAFLISFLIVAFINDEWR